MKSHVNFDSRQYKEMQRQGWNSLAVGWKRWWKVLEQAAQPVSG